MARRILTVLLVTVVLSGLRIGSAVRAAPASQEETEVPVTIYFFWGDGCPHCAEAKPFLEDLVRRYPEVRIEAFEVWYNEDNQTLFEQMTGARGFGPRYVPTIFIGERCWQGFLERDPADIESVVQACISNGCPDAGAGIVPGHEAAATPAGDSTDVTLDAPAVKVRVRLFWGDLGCEQCDASREHHVTQSGFAQLGADSGATALAYVMALRAEFPDIEVSAYEVWITTTSAALFRRVAEAYGVEAVGVPTIFIGDRVWEGFDDRVASEVSAYVQQCLNVGCPAPDEEKAQATPTLEAAEEPEPTSAAEADAEPTAMHTGAEAVLASPPKADTLTVPVLGSVDLGAQSMWVSTALISLVDGFNPCSLWVLSLLIALSLRTGSRKRILTIGLIYIAVTAGVYAMFIAGLFTFMSVIGFLKWIQVAVSVLALFFAAVNIKDYFWYKEGLSFTIADDRKPGIYKRMRRVMNAGDSFWALAGATVALGAGVSLVEFSCTAGFPVIWANLVAAQNVAPLTFVLLLLLYMLIYQIDELAIFGVAVVTLKANRLEEKHGRILKLIGGTLMLALAGVMLINPALMNNLGSSLLIFGGAIVAALAIMVIHRRLLPKVGIYIGTELS